MQTLKKYFVLPRPFDPNSLKKDKMMNFSVTFIGSVWRHGTWEGHGKDMGRNVPCDEQAIGLKGRHQDKQRNSHKKEGEGFQAACICEYGYTYNFYFRNVAALRKYL